MKKITAILIGMLLFVSACGAGADGREQEETLAPSNTEKENMDSEESEVAENLEEKEEDTTQLPEYSTLTEQVAIEDFQLRIVEDNQGKRVMLIEDDQGQEKYKSIFTKKNNRLKIIEFNKGQIFNEVI
ncbi:hypothetical protein AB4Y30_02200 [Ornithinibacillus sp. 4-3]|uniref:Uncharacterized protein n=1 Tax=Ornithinibacillus sp. 4-3 TaxID=3231488 RepID=A0AB39HRC6_9BACI